MSGSLAFFIPHVGCSNQCSFCDQRRISGASEAPAPADVAKTCSERLSDKGDTQIAFFGGSFTAIDRGYMRELLDAAAPFVTNGRASGIRVSTRPDAVDSGVLALLKSSGVTAVELGAQSMLDEVLAANSRGHTAEDVRRAAALIKDTGLSLGVQMMAGLYGEGDPLAAALYTAHELGLLRPDTARVYPAVVVEDTALCGLYRAGRYRPLSVPRAAAICAAVIPLFGQAGTRVIRVGLHADETLRGSVVAGPYHPALGEMAYSRIMRKEIRRVLDGAGRPEKAAVYVHPADVSRTVGYRRCNVEHFRETGFDITVIPRDGVPRGSIQLAEA